MTTTEGGNRVIARSVVSAQKCPIRSLKVHWEFTYSQTVTSLTLHACTSWSAITVMLGSINLELLWLEMYNLWWRISFPTVSWQLPKTCLQTSRIPWKCCPYYRILHRPTTEGIVCGSISFDSRTLLVIISCAHKTQWYLDYILRPVFCCSSCVIPDLLFN